MAAKQHRLNVLQPKRFNTNHTVLVTNCNNDTLGNHCILGVSKKDQESSPVFEVGTSTSTFPLSLGVPASSASSTPSATILPKNRPPNTMARRNARERNRVKQVNQGFQTLRQHIPNNYRLKKMSKVDTLRCALNYIRSLEKVLDISFAPGMLKMENADFELEDDFSPGSISPSQMDSFCGGGGSGESCSDQSYVYGVNESGTTSDHNHSSGQQSYTILTSTHEDLLTHQDTENVHLHEIPIISDENFKKEVEEHFLSVHVN